MSAATDLLVYSERLVRVGISTAVTSTWARKPHVGSVTFLKPWAVHNTSPSLRSLGVGEMSPGYIVPL